MLVLVGVKYGLKTYLLINIHLSLGIMRVFYNASAKEAVISIFRGLSSLDNKVK